MKPTPSGAQGSAGRANAAPGAGGELGIAALHARLLRVREPWLKRGETPEQYRRRYLRACIDGLDRRRAELVRELAQLTAREQLPAPAIGAVGEPPRAEADAEDEATRRARGET